MGINSLNLTIREIETLAQEGDSSNKLPTLINDLEVILNKVVAEMKDELI